MLLSQITQRINRCLSQQDIDTYQRDGAICLRGVLTSDEVTTLRQGIDLNLQRLSPHAKIASKPDDPGKFIEDFCQWQQNKFYQKIIFESPLAGIAGMLTHSQQIRLYHDHMLVKEPGTKQHTPWHQDQPYYNIEGKQNCSMWIPVDPVARSATLEFVAGSHLGPWLMPRSFMDNQAKWFPEGTLAELPDITANRKHYPIIGWEMNPGDIVCFHMLTLHASAGVEGNQRRRVFSVRFMGDDITHAPRNWKTSPDFPGLIDKLPASAAMNHSLFPIVWKEK
jgi:ectoine hydroxylase-related dioxygenase (phytanoyl-CoA dioxygenase family)